MRVSITALAGLTAMTLAVAGCGQTPQTPSPSPSPLISVTVPAPSPSLTPSLTPSPVLTETADPHPDAGDLVISSSGLGPLAVGNGFIEDNPGAAMIEWEADRCGTDVTDPFVGRWIPAGYDDADVNLAGEPTWPFTVDADAAAIHRIDVWGVSARTNGDVGLGSTRSDVIFGHPGVSGPFEFAQSEVWVEYGRDGALVFELVAGEGADAQPTVAYIRIMHPEAPAEFAVAGTDNAAGSC